MTDDFAAHEALARELNDDALRAEYARPYDEYRVGLVAKFLGGILVGVGTLLYGRKPGYAKFKAIEVIARIPYQSWEVAAYTLLTAFYQNEARAIELTKTSAFSRMAQDNETLHVVVISQIVKRLKCADPIRHTLIPLVMSFFYFWTLYFLYMVSRRSALELNYVFENHAYHQYDEFLGNEEQSLKHRMCESEFLALYGREHLTEYQLFESIRNDELIHRNRTIRELNARTR
ncbi:MAG TPA: alternative oxidase [Candidatus Paceibacterota bacterium]|nr:alternative oxidase [Candidatus Paceibacterota bacterium]